MVAGNAKGIARAERKLGLLSWSIALERNIFSQGADEILWTEGQKPLVTEIKRWQLLWRALTKFDIIHFNFGQSIMPRWHLPDESLRRKYHWLKLWVYGYYCRLLELRDLPLLKKAGKGIVVTYQGDDARQGDFCGANFEIGPTNEVEPGYYSVDSDAHKRLNIARFDRSADRIFAVNPDLLHVLPDRAEFIPYSHIDITDWRPIDHEDGEPRVPVVVHAPTHRGVKGTRHVLDAVSRLQGDGIALEFILVEGLPNNEARRLYERADLLVDQLLCGWYGGVAVEFMALGKPVISYIREIDLAFVPEEMRRDLPIINATPATLYSVMKEWLTVRKYELREVGGRGRTYVEKWHDPIKVASKLKGEYETILEKERRNRH